jgi:hypothetical protein
MEELLAETLVYFHSNTKKTFIINVSISIEPNIGVVLVQQKRLSGAIAIVRKNSLNLRIPKYLV